MDCRIAHAFYMVISNRKNCSRVTRYNLYNFFVLLLRQEREIATEDGPKIIFVYRFKTQAR